MRHQGKQQFRMNCGIVCRGELNGFDLSFSLWWVMGGGTANGSAEKRKQRQIKFKFNKTKKREWSEPSQPLNQLK